MWNMLYSTEYRQVGLIICIQVIQKREPFFCIVLVLLVQWIFLMLSPSCSVKLSQNIPEISSVLLFCGSKTSLFSTPILFHLYLLSVSFQAKFNMLVNLQLGLTHFKNCILPYLLTPVILREPASVVITI